MAQHVQSEATAKNRTKKTTRYRYVHIFKSPLICCQGYGDGFDDVVIQGDLDDLRFVAFYTK